MKIENTIGKYVYFVDKNGAFRISEIVSLNGNTITTQDAIGGKERIHPETNRIFGIVKKTVNSVAILEDIEYKPTRIGRKLKNKKIVRQIKAVEIKPLRGKKPRIKRKV
ncbi:MAG: hypothetical protein EHM34_00240 [Nitrosopumilales archaeon]|nr:MAG: hypothetical protein EHM34_00240 [Nitrosopumilales archaeon]